MSPRLRLSLRGPPSGPKNLFCIRAQRIPRFSRNDKHRLAAAHLRSFPNRAWTYAVAPDGGGAEPLRRPQGKNVVAGRCSEAPGKAREAEPVADWSRNGWKRRENRRITKRTQSCAKRGTAPISRRFFMDWLYRRLAKLEQEQVSRVTANPPEPADHS